MKYFTSLHSITFIASTNLIKIKQCLEKIPSSDRLQHLSINLNNILQGNTRNLYTTIYRLNNLKQFEFHCIKDALVSLHLSPENYHNYSHILIIVPANCLSNLKFLRMNNVPTFDTIEFIFQLCPQLQILKVTCHTKYNIRLMIKAQDWEQHLSLMKSLKKIEINVRGLHHGGVIDVSKYETKFWKERNLTAIKYIDHKPFNRFFVLDNQAALLIK
ncbi:unnamed protein product [Rotaria sp. Silwood1]|nr:unnamed protein product [Rotaria sp. Silwood1]CAF3611937.1 unnamed protein product [Rotaria sp. Silwood1]CAF4645391.1 unnamed protein product [Rotaria sp. Silwood1]CAF4829319.1 unnamed protein product [Rotaria sp. Silwood1]